MVATEMDLAEMFFKAKKAAYVSPMTIKEWEASERDDFVLVDVRKSFPMPPPTRIPGSMWIPEDQLVHRMAELPKDKALILYCWDTRCSLATSAAVTLYENGYKAKELYGGIAAWTTMKQPLVEAAGTSGSKDVGCAC